MDLTSSQAAAAYSRAPRRLIIAGPGSGKTHTTIAAVLNDLRDNVTADCILAVTFTNKAAGELSRRLYDHGVTPAHCGTIHALALKILQAANPGKRVVMLSDEDALATISAVAKSIRTTVVPEQVQKFMAGLIKGSADNRAALKTVAAAYRKFLAMENAVDFNTVLEAAVQVAQHYVPPIGDGWLLYVDEFQDTAPIEMELLNRIRATRRWYVGDPDQNAYEWRGTTLENILAVARSEYFTTFHLEDNFRSGAAIIDTARKVIVQNRHRVETPPQIPHRVDPGLVVRRVYASDAEELADIAEGVKEPGTWGVLCRYNATRKEIENGLRARGLDVPPLMPALPHDYAAGCALLTFMAAPDSELARLNLIRRCFAPPAAQRMAEDPAKPLPFVKSWPDVFQSRDQLLESLRGCGMSKPFLTAVWGASVKTGSCQPSAILLGLRDTGEDPAPARVQVLTIHGAKGLEFDNVWMAACDDARVMDPDEGETRLAYIAATRARKMLWITRASLRKNPYTSRLEPRTPSRQFI